jgi:hypothetical protein
MSVPTAVRIACDKCRECVLCIARCPVQGLVPRLIWNGIAMCPYALVSDVPTIGTESDGEAGGRVDQPCRGAVFVGGSLRTFPIRRAEKPAIP